MLSRAQSKFVAVAAQAQRRTFVSPATLSRTWEKHTVSDLKKEARARGLSSAGKKNILISRLQEHEKSISISASVSAPSAESASVLGDVPGVPPAHEFHQLPPDGFMNLQLPDANYDLPPRPIQIPYVPDFWTSSTPHVSEPEPLVEPPKILVVAGAATHHGGGPVLSTLPAEDLSDPTSDSEAPRQPGQGGFWDDAAESLNVPYPRDVSNSLSSAWASFKASLK